MVRNFFLSREGVIGVLVMTCVLAAVVVYFNHFGTGSGTDSSSSSSSAGSERSAGGFIEVAKTSGINFKMNFLTREQGVNFKVNLYDHGCGVAVADFDGSGHEGIYLVNQLGRNALYRNNGDGTFEDVTADAGVGLGDRICVGATFADTRNNGRQDLFVTSTRGGNVLFRNMGDGTFRDFTKEANLTCIAHSQTAVFFDYDNDGYLDLFVTNTAQWTSDNYDDDSHYYPGPSDLTKMATSPIEYNILYHNNGDGTFTDVTEKAGLKGKGWGGDAAVFDYNEDGYLDLFVTNMFGASQLYRNNGDGTFTDVTRDVLGKTSWGAIAAKTFDFNNDGHLGLFVTDMHSDMWLKQSINPRTLPEGMLAKKYNHVTGPRFDTEEISVKAEERSRDLFHIDYKAVLFGNTCFQKLASGTFAEVSDKANLETFWPWGIATGDFDNDGHEDLFIPSGMGYPFFYWPNALMMNNGDGTFTDRAKEAGIEPPPGGEYMEQKIRSQPAARSSRSAAVADFDGKGRLNIIVNNFNDHPYYFRNNYLGKNYVAFRLEGGKRDEDTPRDPVKKTNRDAVGALVRVHVGDKVMVRQVQAAGGYLSQSSRTLHFGLGDATHVDWVEIVWPSGIMQRIDAPEVNKVNKIAEPAQSS
jgi:enediyne biosynthesis protein E4